MIQSRFDTFVNKILRESLQGGNITSTSVSPAKPQNIENGQETTEDDTEQEGEQSPITNTQQPTKQQIPQQQVSNSSADSAALKEFIKNQEEFQKKLIATQTAAMKSNTTQQATAPTNIPAPVARNAIPSQVLKDLLNIKA